MVATVTADSVAGVTLLVLGLLIDALTGLAVARYRALRNSSMIATVVPAADAVNQHDVALAPDLPTTPTSMPRHQLRPAPTIPPAAINLGDRVRVYPDRQVPSQAKLYHAPAPEWIGGFLVVAALAAAAGIAVLVRGAPGRGFESAGSAVVACLGLVGLSCVGVLGIGLAGRLLRGLRGSRRVSGRVVDSEIVVSTKKALYQPLVEYAGGGASRRVWGTPRWRKPGIGEQVRVRIAGRSPHEAVRTTPLALFGLLMLLSSGLVGFVGFAALLLSLW